MAEPGTILVAARDEEERIGSLVEALLERFPGSEVVVADDGSRDATAEVARAAGARVLSFGARGKGQTLSLAERECGPGTLLLCDGDLSPDAAAHLARLAEVDADVAVAAFRERQGGGFGLAKWIGRDLARGLVGRETREPLSGQRLLSERARQHCFPLAAGFGCEIRMTIDAVRAGLTVEETELPLRHRATGRDLRGFAHRGRQLVELALACGPLARNFRGLRLPLVGWLVPLGGFSSPRRVRLAVAAIAAIGLADDRWSGPERGLRGHLRSVRTTGMLKLIGIPTIGLAATRSVSGGVLVALSANGLNLLDTRPGRALKVFLAGSLLARRGVGGYGAVAVLLAPYDQREMTMLGDAGSNALGAVLGFSSVACHGVRGRWVAIGALAGLTLLSERRSLGELIEHTPVLREIDAWGRVSP